MLERVRSTAGVDLSGIGIGCTGPVDPMTGEVGEVEFLPGWKGCNPVARLAERFQIGVAMENDADAAALGEAQWGAGRPGSPVLGGDSGLEPVSTFFVPVGKWSDGTPVDAMAMH